MNPRRQRSRRFGSLLAVASICAVALTCTEGPIGLGESRLTSLGLAPAFSERAASIYRDLAAFQLNVNNVRLRLERGDGDTAADTTVLLAAGDDSVAIEVSVRITGSSEELLANVELRDGNTVLFSGKQMVVARIGEFNPTPAPLITLEYTGPGADATSIQVAPADTTIPQSGSVTYRSSATNSNGQPVTEFPVVWSVVDPNRGSISATGVYAPTPGRYSTRIIGRMPQGQADTALVSVVPPATTVALISGDGQSGAVGTALAAPIVIESRASDGLPVPGAAVTVAVTAGGGTVSTTSVTTGADARASVSLTLGTTAGGNTVRFSGPGLTPLDVSATAVAGAPVSLAFTTQPPNTTAGTAFGVAVTARDQFGNTAAYSGNVEVAISSGTGTEGAQLFGTRSVAASNGVATLSDLRVDKAAAGYTLSATSGALAAATSAPFAITHSPGAVLAFSTALSDATAGTTFSASAVVRDTLGNLATSDATLVTVAIGTNPAGGTLGGTTSAVVSNGTATFVDLTIDKSGNGYTLVATAPGRVGATSTAFDVRPGAAASVAITSTPTSVTSGAAFGVTATARDANGNVATGFTGNVTLSIATNPSAGTLSGTTTVAAANGVATFTGLSIDKAGVGYVLSAAATGVTSGSSASITVVAASAVSLAFTTQPVNTTAGTAFTVAVAARDAQGNAAAYAGDVTVSISEGSGTAGAQLFGTLTVAAANGVATVPGLRVDKAGTGYTLTAMTSGLSSATSASFAVASSPAAILALVAPIETTPAGASFGITVVAKDTLGNTATDFTGNVTLSIGNNPSGGTLSGTTTVAAVNGVATLMGLSIDKAGEGYTLTATATGVTPATSAAISVTAGSAAALAFTTHPPNTTAGTAFIVAVAARDGQGNPTAYTGDITVAITAGTGTEGAQLFGTLTVAAVDGVATFADLRVDKSGVGYTLTATASGLSSASSAAFAVMSSPAAVLEFVAPIENTTSGATFGAGVVAKDTLGNYATTFTGNVTIALGNNPSEGTLGGTLTVAASGGVAVFTNLSIDYPGTGYTLTAVADGLTAATSNPFDVTVAASAALYFTSAPTTVTAGQGFSVTVTAKNDAGQTVTTFNGPVDIDIASNPSSGTLSGNRSVTAVNGVATFTALSIDKAGVGYVLMAYAPESDYSHGYTGSITVEGGEAASLAFSTQPKNVQPNETFTVRVAAKDASGNVATSFAKDVTIGFGTNAGDGTLAGTMTVTAVNGVATFSDLSINLPGTGYTLVASSEVGEVTSISFNVRPLGEARILYWVDSKSGYDVVPEAVSQAGQPLTQVETKEQFVAQLLGNSWDVVIFGEQGNAVFDPDSLQPVLQEHVAAGGRLLAVTWFDSALLPLMQATLAGQNFTSFATTEHAIFTGVSGNVQLYNPGWSVFTQDYKPALETGAQCLGVTPAENCAAILGNGNRTLLLGPLFDTYCSPEADPVTFEPICSAPDGVRLVANSVTYLLSQSAAAVTSASAGMTRPTQRTLSSAKKTQGAAATTRVSNCRSPRCGAP